MDWIRPKINLVGSSALYYYSGLKSVTLVVQLKQLVAGTDGVVLSILVNIPAGLTHGQYDLTLTNVIVSKSARQNVVSITSNAVLTVNGVCTGLSDVKPEILIKKLENEICVQSNQKCSIQIFDMQGKFFFKDKFCV